MDPIPADLPVSAPVVCVYCGEPAGGYDEHDECVWQSLVEAVE